MHSIKKQKFIAGFGLVELLVSIGIALLIMTVVMAKHSSSNSAVLLRSQAYEVALTAREIQLSAVSATGDAGSFRSAYGVYFNTATPNYYYSFRDDASANNFFTSGEEIGQRNNLDPRFEIGDIRLVTGLVENSIGAGADVAIIFERPNFDARFFTAPNTEVNSSVNAIEIDVRISGTNEVRTVEISRTGQIIVQ